MRRLLLSDSDTVNVITTSYYWSGVVTHKGLGRPGEGQADAVTPIQSCIKLGMGWGRFVPRLVDGGVGTVGVPNGGRRFQFTRTRFDVGMIALRVRNVPTQTRT